MPSLSELQLDAISGAARDGRLQLLQLLAQRWPHALDSHPAPLLLTAIQSCRNTAETMVRVFSLSWDLVRDQPIGFFEVNSVLTPASIEWLRSLGLEGVERQMLAHALYNRDTSEMKYLLDTGAPLPSLNDVIGYYRVKEDLPFFDLLFSHPRILARAGGWPLNCPPEEESLADHFQMIRVLGLEFLDEKRLLCDDLLFAGAESDETEVREWVLARAPHLIEPIAVLGPLPVSITCHSFLHLLK